MWEEKVLTTSPSTLLALQLNPLNNNFQENLPIFTDWQGKQLKCKMKTIFLNRN